ncbi:hypothetical protein [Flammeovirga sp. SubArs3]|uniref:hypothetical protein n=1 Tax=Flammeovirga sp. SubArs3 TaxID=2995316 RepID=UPI00248AF3EC|nr:hypothetical protein [Flammeovirga sp. SubArs3]
MIKHLTLLLLSILLLGACQKEENSFYVGVPKDLRYVGIGEYYCGEAFTTDQPSVFTGGEEVIFTLLDVKSDDYEGEDLMENFRIQSRTGIITIRDFNDLSVGRYTIDVEVKNSMGATSFTDILDFTADQIAPQDIIYMPNIYSFYGDDTEIETNRPHVKGGGPYSFRLTEHTDIFSIDEELGRVKLTNNFPIEDDQIEVFEIGIEVANTLGELVKDAAVTIEIIGKNVGQLFYNAISFLGTPTSYGLQNAVHHTTYGVVEKEIDGEAYITELNDEDNGPAYTGGLWRRAWAGVAFNFENEDGFVNEKIVKGYWSWNQESRGDLISDVIDLSYADEEGYLDITGFWRYTGGAQNLNQHLGVMICKQSEYNEDAPETSNWTVLANDISEDLMPFPSGTTTINERLLREEGNVQVSIPSNFLKEEVRVALRADFFNPELGGLARRFYIYQMQVRGK